MSKQIHSTSNAGISRHPNFGRNPRAAHHFHRTRAINSPVSQEFARIGEVFASFHKSDLALSHAAATISADQRARSLVEFITTQRPKPVNKSANGSKANPLALSTPTPDS